MVDTALAKSTGSNIKASTYIKQSLNKLLSQFGYRFSKIKPNTSKNPIDFQKKLLNAYKINTIFDVGANIGQFGRKLRKKINFKGRIISFEPMSHEFSQLSERSKQDPLWEVENFALGEEIGKAEIQISGNSVSSSLLDMLPSVIDVCSEKAKYVGKEEITVKTIDSIFDNYFVPGDNIYLKIDTQGYEHAVLKGALKSLPNIKGIQLELSFIPFYKGSRLFNDMVLHMDKLGYQLMSIQPVLEDPKTGRQLQVDGIFFRE
ncbi:MAG: FkbM family methyltransferase [Desulfobacteraceae bacterium]